MMNAAELKAMQDIRNSVDGYHAEEAEEIPNKTVMDNADLHIEATPGESLDELTDRHLAKLKLKGNQTS